MVDGQQHVVDSTGKAPGSHLTIGAALAVAKEGDTIVVREGRYEENACIETEATKTTDSPAHCDL